METRLTTLANPAPLGLFGFGLTTMLLNIHNAGFYELNVMIMAMGIFYGGSAQIIAGIMEFKKGNTFGTLAFTSYGFFWLTLVFIWVAPGLGLPKTDALGMAWYLTMWGLFSFVLFIGTLKGNTTGKIVFASVVVLFGLLAAHNFTGSEALLTLAGYEGIFCGFCAFYEASALVLNEKFGRVVLPL